MPDFVAETLNFLDTNWDTNNYSPKPALIQQEDSRYYYSQHDRTDERSKDHDLTSEATVKVNSRPTVTRSPIGTEFDNKVTAPVTVRVEAAHADVRGTVADAAEFKDLVGEVRRTLNVERVYPLPDAGYHSLVITEEDNRSTGHADYYRLDITAEYRGFNDLP